MTCDYATGRDLNPLERLMFSAAARDRAAAAHVHAFGTPSIGPARFLAPPALARAAWVNARTRRAGARLLLSRSYSAAGDARARLGHIPEADQDDPR
jgi:hypothetical protein